MWPVQLLPTLLFLPEIYKHVAPASPRHLIDQVTIDLYFWKTETLTAIGPAILELYWKHLDKIKCLGGLFQGQDTQNLHFLRTGCKVF